MAGSCELAVLLPVRTEGYASMEKYLKVGPHIMYVCCACPLNHFLQHGEKPRRHARNACDIGPERSLDKSRQLEVPVGHEGDLTVGHSHEIGGGLIRLIRVADRSPTCTPRWQGVEGRGKAASEYKVLPEKRRLAGLDAR